MDQILNRPEIQSAVLPFIVSLSLCFGLKKITASAWIWAVFVAFLVSAGLINGLTITPLTGTRKIILLILASFIVAALIHHGVRSISLQRFGLWVLGILALIWVFWKVMARMDAPEIAVFLGAGIGLVLWLLWAFDRIGNNETQLHAAGFSLLLGTGLSATLGASALLGQLGLSLAAASGAVLLAWVLTGKAVAPANSNRLTPTLPYALATALLGLAAVIFASLPWYTLIPLASIPLVTSLVPKKFDSRFVNTLITSLPGLAIGLAVSFWVWKSGSSSSGY